MSIRFIARTILILLILATAGLAAEANQTRELPPELGKAVTTAQKQLQQVKILVLFELDFLVVAELFFVV